MKEIWSMDLDTAIAFYELLEVVEKECDHELCNQEKEYVLKEFMNHLGIKPLGRTELNKEEFLKELLSKNKKILNIDKDGIQIIKKKENNEI